MAIQKARQFSYRPPDRRRKQLAQRGDEETQPRIDLPKAGDGRTSAGGGTGGMLGAGLKLFLMLAAVVALALVMAALG